MSAKPRSDSKLRSLPPHYKAELVRWLVEENMAYTAAKEKLWEKFSVRTSEGAISNFYGSECFALRSSEAKAFAEQIEAQLLKDGPEKFDAATLALVKQKAFERAYAKDGSIDELATLAKIIGDSAKAQMQAQKLALDERNFQLETEKFREAMKSNIEKGLDALHAECGTNSEALQLFEKFKAAVMKSVGAKTK